MSGGAAAQTLRDSAVRLNHRLRRFAGANALKKIALNVIAKVKNSVGGCRFLHRKPRTVFFLAYLFGDSKVGQLGQSQQDTYLLLSSLCNASIRRLTLRVPLCYDSLSREFNRTE